MRLRAGEGLLRETLANLRACGRGRDECAVYWTGPLDDPLRADAVVHPAHTASPTHYEVHHSWAIAFALRLAADHRAVRMQVHVHQGAAYHSETDDKYSLVSTPGFLSLVIPECAQGPLSLAGCHLSRLMPDGNWRSVRATEWIELEP